MHVNEVVVVAYELFLMIRLQAKLKSMLNAFFKLLTTGMLECNTVLLSMLYWLIKLFFICRMQGRVCITLIYLLKWLYLNLPLYVPGVWTQFAFFFDTKSIFEIIISVHLTWQFHLNVLHWKKEKTKNLPSMQTSVSNTLREWMAVNITHKNHVF